MGERSIGEALGLFDGLAALREEQLAALAAVVERRSFETDELLYGEGAEGSNFLIIGSGRLCAQRETPMGPQRVATLREGDIVGEISVLDGKPRSSSVIGLERGHAWRFDTIGIGGVVAADPEIEVGLLRTFCRSLAGKIRQANQVMTEIMAAETGETRLSTTAAGEQDSLDDEAKRRLLREHGMASDDLQQLSTYLKAQRYAAGSPIFLEGEPGDTLYLVADGRVRISRRIKGMGEEALAILGRGEVFGEMAWIDEQPRSADAVAHSGGCRVLAISRQHLDGTLWAKPETGARFLKVVAQILCSRVRSMNDQLVAYRTMAWF